MIFTVVYDLKLKGKVKYSTEVYTYHCIANNANEAAKKCIEIESNEYMECRVLAVNLVNEKEYKEAMSNEEVWKEYSTKENEFIKSIISAYKTYEEK